MVRASPVECAILFGSKIGRIGFSGGAAIWRTAQSLLQSGSDLLRKLLKRSRASLR